MSVSDRKKWKHLTERGEKKKKRMSSGSFKNVISKMFIEIIYLIYMYKQELAKITYNGWYAIKPNQT